MNQLDHGGPAFPVPGDGAFATVKDEGGDARQVLLNGMTLRDYFAAKALNGVCASGSVDRVSSERPTSDVARAAAEAAYVLADAMLKARAAQ